MATQQQIDDLRLAIGDVNNPLTGVPYTDEELEDLIDRFGSVDCAAAYVWKNEISQIAKNMRQLKKATQGVETHEFNSIKDQLSAAREMYDFYSDECEKSKGAGSAYLGLVSRPKVAGILNTDQDGNLITGQ